jgi:carbon starvation protein
MFGIANQLLAAIALALGTTIILQRSKRKIYALTTFLPFVFVLVTTMAAGVESIPAFLKIGPGDPAYKGFLNSGLCITMLVLTAVIAVDSARSWAAALRKPAPAGNRA